MSETPTQDPATPAEAPAKAAAPSLHYFGVRHHGPGCARSLLQALQALQPDCVLLEGPPEGQPLLEYLTHAELQPPVALLGYCPDRPELALYAPFAVFSPEWQAMQWAARQQVPLQFIDLPLTHKLALWAQQQDAEAAAEAASGEDEGDESGESDESETGASPNAEPDAAEPNAPEPAAPAPPAPHDLDHEDPLSWLARAAGHADGEAWWNAMVEERLPTAGAASATDAANPADADPARSGIFAAIAEAMAALRAELPPPAPDTSSKALLEARREAHMRQCIRAALKAGHQRIAVICGAWHLGGLQVQGKGAPKASADAALLKGLPKVKLQCTWVPWTYRHLTFASGYGAGVPAPGWYEHLWHSSASANPAQARSVGWLARVAALMRARDLDCSSAHLIEAVRLADTLAALRQRAAPSLPELHEASRAVLTMGDDTALQFIEDALYISQRMGQVPEAVPTVPLQRDLAAQQKSLRLKPEATQKTLDLDLRQPNDLARSHLLHRLRILGVPWGEQARTGRSARGTFHEVWQLQWQPEFAMHIIEASQWGQTVQAAASARANARAQDAAPLQELARLLDAVLLADLPASVPHITQALQNRAAVSGDAPQLLQALPPLANTFRYGNVRQTDTAQVAHVLDGLIVRAAIALPLACSGITEEAAGELREQLLQAHAAVALRGTEGPAAQQWQRALLAIAQGGQAHALLQGVATRLLLDGQVWDSAAVAQALSLHLSQGSDPAAGAAWLEGFVNRNALVLLHDEAIWQLVDSWLCSLNQEHFVHVLPLVRRTFSDFDASERRDLAHKAKTASTRQGAPAAPATPAWDATQADWPIPYLQRLLCPEEPAA